MKWSESRSVVSSSLWPHELYTPWTSPGQNTGVGSHSLLQGIFPTQGLNPGLPHFRQIFYQLSHQESPGFWPSFPTPVLLPGKSLGWRSLVGCSPWSREESDTTEWLHFPALEKEMATHSSVLAWRVPGTGEPGGLLSLGSHRVRHNWSDLAAMWYSTLVCVC